MNRAIYSSYIEERLASLASRVEVRGKLNLLELHHHSENFYMHLLNELFGWQLQNMNVTKQNAEAVDLIDRKNQLIIQVSATATKRKIASALTKDLSAYSGYTFKFVSISKDAGDLRNKTYRNHEGIAFDPQQDILDIASILSNINALDIKRLERIRTFIKKELGSDVAETRIETNLASIINILAEEDWDARSGDYQCQPFVIESKIDSNKLKTSATIIDDYKIHHSRIDGIYAEFDKLGVNKSSSVLLSIQKEYLENSQSLSDDALFSKIVERVLEKIRQSANYVEIPLDELDLCVNILVVDAFIRCKIFENPEESIDVAA